MTYNGVNASSEPSEAEYDDIEDDVDLIKGNQSVKLSDFEENVDVIGEVHSDCDINEIYVEKGILGKHLRGNQMARSSL